MHLLRFRDLKERGICRDWGSLKRFVERFGFPPGRYIAPNSRVWTEAEVNAWIDALPTRVLNPVKPPRKRPIDGGADASAT